MFCYRLHSILVVNVSHTSLLLIVIINIACCTHLFLIHSYLTISSRSYMAITGFNKATNLKQATKFVQESISNEAQVITLCKCFNSPYDMILVTSLYIVVCNIIILYTLILSNKHSICYNILCL